MTEGVCRRLVQHGYLPEREIVAGIGRVAVPCPRERDHAGEASAQPLLGPSAALPPHAVTKLSPIAPAEAFSRSNYFARCSELTLTFRA